MNPDTTLMDRIGREFRESGSPWSALLETTYRCSLDCFHCCNTPSDIAEFTTKEIQDVLKQLADLKCLYLTLSGGEFFMRPDYREILEEARRLNFAISIFTNAVHITPDLARNLKPFNPLEISVTLFSADPEIHDEMTRTPGSHSRTLKGIEALLEQKLKVRARCVVSKQNNHNILKLKELCKRYNIECSLDYNLMPGRGSDISILNDRVLPPAGGPHPAANPVTEPDPCSLQLICSAGIHSLSICPQGDVKPCIHFPLSAGSLHEKSLKEIWDTSPLFIRLRNLTIEDLRECRVCSRREFCGRCQALALIEDGDLLGKSSWACRSAAGGSATGAQSPQAPGA